MKPNIGVDLDDTVYHTALEIITVIGRFYNQVFSLHDLTSHSIEKSLCVDKDVVRDAVDITIERTDLYMIDGAKDTLKWLSLYYNIHFITFRPPEFIQSTLKLLNRFEVPYELHMCDRAKGKSSIISKFDIKYHIEDFGEVAEDLYEKTKCTVLLKDRPWNYSVEENDRIIRVFNWTDIWEYFRMKGMKHG